MHARRMRKALLAFAGLLLAAVAVASVHTDGAPRAEAEGGAAALSAGIVHTCALTTAGGVECWGANNYGELGDGQSCGTVCTTPVDVSSLMSGVTAVSAGGDHTCALTTAGGVKCWGFNSYGELGDGTTVFRTTPVDVSGLTSGVAAVSAGDNHTCAVTTTGGVKCWGFNDSGQLGDGTTTNRTTPVDVSGLGSGVAAIAAGASHTCALTTAGGVRCWGSNYVGALGDGTTTDRTTPVDVSGLSSGVAAVSAGGHTCALTTAGGMKCWGDNFGGQLGDGTTIDRLTPVDVSGLTSGVSALSAGEAHTCAVTAAGGVRCWGFNADGQLGDGRVCGSASPLVACTTPVDVSGLTSGVAAVSAGSAHTCALTTTGGVKCWGKNGSGELGNGTAIGPQTCINGTGLDVCSTTPVNVIGLKSGDANCDDSVNAIDALLVLQLSAGLVSSLPCQPSANVNIDGRTDSLDATIILRYVARLIPSLPVSPT